MKILLVASEVFPFAKVGGLADVTSSLAMALASLGHEPYLVLPKYGSIKARIQDLRRKRLTVTVPGHSESITISKTMLKERIPVYLVENDRYFGREEIYTKDEIERFLFFSLSIPAALSQLDLRPDVIHCHDWHTALIPLWLRKAKMKLPCVFTIHNLAYQGSFDQQFFLRSGLSSVWHEHIPANAPRPALNFMSQAILLADIVTTVSPTYASEILTPEYGEGLQQLLSYRRNELHGIANGIDYDEYNPASDPNLETNYDSTTIEKRSANKLALQRKGRLPENPDVPLFGMVSRLEEQKGIDLLLQGIDSFVAETRAQLVIIGQGKEHYQKLLSEAARKYPHRLSVFITHDERLARLVYGGCDMFLMPSRFEPCGLGQLIAMRYGAIPVVRRTGGLADTVKDVAERDGNGFVFQKYDVSEMLKAIKRAEDSFYHRREWQILIRHNMNLDFSWKTSAKKYEELYLRAQRLSQSHQAVMANASRDGMAKAKKKQVSSEDRMDVQPVRYDISLLSDDDLFLFNEGTHYRLYEKLGAHPITVEGAKGTYFALWAPNAKQVSVIGEFNNWSKSSHPLRPKGQSGIWEGFIPGVTNGTIYKYHVVSQHHGYQVEKADPFAFYTETPPGTASIVWEFNHNWEDQTWMQKRHGHNALDAPISIYELHLGSWRRVPEEGNRLLTYRELAPKLAEYLQHTGFTHVEFLPVMEHPFYGSWGYQITGYFAPTSRYGTPDDFMYLVDYLHRHDIGVILDWVPSHFPNDGHGLGYFDGTHLYEHADPRKGVHPDWNSFVFNYGRHEVRSFLLSNAMFWLDKYHVDGLRIDAVASMLYLDYGRREGQWIPNQYGGRENLEAIAFLRRLNEAVYREKPDVQTIAEESTAWPMVSRPTYVGGLGFGLKWDMGWMHDTLEYMAKDPIYRKYHHNNLTFRLLYAFFENFILPLSHDEVVHGKGSLLAKMPGDDWQKFANLRLLLGYMYAQPGKKLLFMGGEFGQWREWAHDESLDWHLLQYAPHSGLQHWVSELNHLYKSESALHELDFDPGGFEWIDCNDVEQSVISLLRKGRARDSIVAVVCNFTPVTRFNYRIGVPRPGFWRELLNSDAREYGGSGQGNLGGVEATALPWHGRPYSMTVTLPPLAIVFLKPS